MIQKDGSILINEWEKGIADSPNVGFGSMVNVSTYEDGVIKPSEIQTLASGTAITAPVLWIVSTLISGNQVLFALDNTGRVYTNQSGSWATLSARGGSGNGLAVWKNYLFLTTNSELHVYGPLDNNPTWKPTSQTPVYWKTLANTDTAYNPIFVSKDDRLYIGNGNIVAMLTEGAGQTFNPDTASTYQWFSNALDLPTGYRIKCLEEIESRLLIGTFKGGGITDVPIGDIFIWNKYNLDPSYEKALSIGENGINAMLNINNIVYILGGLKGKIYKTNGTDIVLEKELKFFNLSFGQYLNFYPGSIGSKDGKLYFGVSFGTGTPAASFGIYSYNLKTGAVVLEKTPSDSAANTVSALLFNFYDFLYSSFSGGTTYGIDRNTGTRYSSAYFESPLYHVGTFYNKKTFKNIEVLFSQPGSAVTLSYRKNLLDSYTTIGTLNLPTSAGGILPCPIIETEMVQIKCAITNGSAVGLKSILLS